MPALSEAQQKFDFGILAFAGLLAISGRSLLRRPIRLEIGQRVNQVPSQDLVYNFGMRKENRFSPSPPSTTIRSRNPSRSRSCT